MRTTLEIDDDVLAAARSLASERHTSIGTALSDLARQGLRPVPPKDVDGLPVFDVPSSAPLITPEMVDDALEDP